MDKELGGLQSLGCRVGRDWGTKTILKPLDLKAMTLSHLYRDKSWGTDRTLCLAGALKGYYDQTYMETFGNKGFQY